MASLICSNCGWKPSYPSELYKIDAWIPPCPICESVMEGYEIKDASL